MEGAKPQIKASNKIDDKPDLVLRCAHCGESEQEGTKKTILNIQMVEAMDPYDRSDEKNPKLKSNFTPVIVGDKELVQVNHRLPIKVEGVNTQARGMCKQTYHLSCLQDYICKQSRKNKGKATKLCPLVVDCPGCKNYAGAKPLSTGQIFHAYGAFGKEKVLAIEARNKVKPLPDPESLPDTPSGEASGWRCAECGTDNDEGTDSCETCGSSPPDENEQSKGPSAQEVNKKNTLVQLLAYASGPAFDTTKEENQYINEKVESNIKHTEVMQPYQDKGFYKRPQGPANPNGNLKAAMAALYNKLNDKSLADSDYAFAASKQGNLSQDQAAALVCLAGNEKTYKKAIQYCGQASSFSDMDVKKQFEDVVSEVDTINQWADSAFGELPAQIKQCIKYVNDPQRYATADLYKQGSVVQWNSFQSAEVYQPGISKAPEQTNVIYQIHSKTGRDISPFSQLGDQEILFAPGTQFLVCKSIYDGESQCQLIYLREINIGGQGKAVLWFEETLKYATDYGILDQAYKNRVDILSFTNMTGCNNFVNNEKIFNRAFQFSDIKAVVAQSADGKTKPKVMFLAKQLAPKAPLSAQNTALVAENTEVAKAECADGKLANATWGQGNFPQFISQNNIGDLAKFVFQ